MATKKKTDAPEPEAKPDPKTAEHVPAAGFRKEVEGQPAGDLNIDPKEPYPTGNPPDPREAYHRIHGHYPAEEPKEAKDD